MDQKHQAPTEYYCAKHRNGGITSSTVSTKPCAVCGDVPTKTGGLASSAPKDVIDIVKELQKDREREDTKELLRMRRDNPANFLVNEFPKESAQIMNLLETYSDHFPSIAQALLDRDEKLKIAVEALEKLSKLGNEPYPGNSDGNVMAQKALSRIKAL